MRSYGTSFALLNFLLWVPVAETFLSKGASSLPRPQHQQTCPFDILICPSPVHSSTIPSSTALDARNFRFWRRFRDDCSRKTYEDADEANEQGLQQPQLRRFSPRLRKRLRRTLVSAAIAASFLLRNPDPSLAANAKGNTVSLRPGMTVAQREEAQNGNLEKVLQELEERQEAQRAQQKASAAKKKTPRKKATKSSFDDYGDDEDDMEENAVLEEAAASMVISQEAKDEAERLKEGRRDNFAGYHQEATKSLYIKVGVAFFVPTYGTLAVREFVRRRKEADYIEKGLEVLKRQKAEYFNETEVTDEDDEDDEDDDEDDDDDYEDDDDDYDEPVSRRKPRPKPDGGGGDSGGTDGNGYGKPSDEDLDRLNKLYGKS